MDAHPFKPQGSKLPLYLTLGGMIIVGIITLVLGLLFWSEPLYQANETDESTEGTFLEGTDAGMPGAGANTPAAEPR